jgi:hypothetical protein
MIIPEGSRQAYYMSQGKLFTAPIIGKDIDRELEMMVDYWELTPVEFGEAMAMLDILLENK